MKTLQEVNREMDRLEALFADAKSRNKKLKPTETSKYCLLKKVRNYLELNPREAFIREMLADTESKLSIYSARIKKEIKALNANYEKSEQYGKELISFYDIKGLKDRIKTMKFILNGNTI